MRKVYTNDGQALGMVSVPMFGPSRAEAQAGSHAVLLDGERASFAFSVGNADRLLADDDPLHLSWSWSSNLRHSLVLDPTLHKLLVRRWDKRHNVQEYPRPGYEEAQQLLETFTSTEPPSIPTVIDRMITVFRIVRTNIEDLGGTSLDVLHAFNALLVVTDAVKRRIITPAEWSAATRFGQALALIEQKRLAPLHLGMVSKSVLRFAIQELAESLSARDRETQYDLDPDLLIRHAAGVLYQEAHAELSRPTRPFHQRSLFPLVSLEAPAPLRPAASDIHFTDPSLARALVERAFAVLRSLGPLPARVEALDPACGSGVFLIEALREIPRGSGEELVLRGVDISPVSCAMTDFSLRRVVRDEAVDSASVEVDVRPDDSLALDPLIRGRIDEEREKC